jgi:hypothetical protein
MTVSPAGKVIEDALSDDSPHEKEQRGADPPARQGLKGRFRESFYSGLAKTQSE